MNIQDARQTLIEFISVLNGLNIPYWLTDGTLLGFYREGSFIEHDIDMDIGVMINDYNSKLKKEFLNNGFKMMHQISNPAEGGFEQSFVKRGIKTDIFYFYEEDDYLWHGAWIPANGKQFGKLLRYKYDKFKTKGAVFLGMNVMIPDDPLKYIITKYGEDWEVPNKKWNWAYGPANLMREDL